MATGTALALRVSYRVHDKGQTELDAAEYLSFVNDAIQDLSAAGWLEPLAEDETTTMAEDTYEYDVPAGFAFVYKLCEQSEVSPVTYDIVVPLHQYRIGLDASGDPELIFNGDLWAPRSGKTIKVIGQKRPSVDIVGSATIVAGMEAFIRERAVSYAAEFLAGGVSEYAAQRKALAQTAWVKSHQMLAWHPMEFRCWPNSIHVPGR